MSDKLFTYNKTSLEKELNKAKEITLGALYNEGVITRDQYEELAGGLAIVLRERGAFGELWDKLRGKPPEDTCTYTVVREVQYGVSEQAPTKPKKSKKEKEEVPNKPTEKPPLEIDDE
jgi:hypothetical protein